MSTEIWTCPYCGREQIILSDSNVLIHCPECDMFLENRRLKKKALCPCCTADSIYPNEVEMDLIRQDDIIGCHFYYFKCPVCAFETPHEASYIAAYNVALRQPDRIKYWCSYFK